MAGKLPWMSLGATAESAVLSITLNVLTAKPAELV